jgi:NADH-quinone oxidoreductase subunit N
MKWLLFIPELSLLVMAALFFSLSMLRRPNPRRDFHVALFLAALGVLVSLATVRFEGTLFHEVYRVDLFSQVFKVLLAMGLFLVVCLCSELNSIRDRRHPEFYLLLATCTLGLMMLVSAVELLTIYIALELASYSLYILVPLRKGDGVHMEAGIKYFLLGAATSAVMLFGLASLYGATHTTHVVELLKVLPDLISSPMAFLGLLLTMCGFFFKLALFPFHIWAPTVYQGAANQVTAYVATATKVTAMAVLTRIVALSGGSSVQLIHVLVALAVASMTLGNLVAIVQKDMKRLLAYSAISHAGYVLIGILSMSQSGYAGAIFYAVAYLAMVFTCFLVVVKVAYDGSDLKIWELAGLHRRSPLLAMALMVGVFSLGGIPPTIGFTGKFLVFVAAMQNGYFYLVFIAMINVVISLYYYALVVKAAYLQEPEEELPRIQLTPPTKILTSMMIIFIVVGGIFPHHLYELAKAAARLLV